MRVGLLLGTASALVCSRHLPTRVRASFARRADDSMDWKNDTAIEMSLRSRMSESDDAAISRLLRARVAEVDARLRDRERDARRAQPARRRVDRHDAHRLHVAADQRERRRRLDHDKVGRRGARRRAGGAG